ncbi:hypothetical protein GCM10010145_29090 [Streptomyces ruber]|uniref:Uncharacterized protein n=2 Tax=Streptomyces TaxID=1883 RepID=A0A918BBG4_9ACTN|nr:hypothetical protein GCM10010145_29090 [Streptomyces ruber]
MAGAAGNEVTGLPVPGTLSSSVSRWCGPFSSVPSVGATYAPYDMPGRLEHSSDKRIPPGAGFRPSRAGTGDRGPEPGRHRKWRTCPLCSACPNPTVMQRNQG